MPDEIKTCGTCRYWKQLGIEDSGLPSGWRYPIGECTNPNDILGTYAGNGKKDIPSFATFYCWKRRRKSQKEAQ